MRILMSVLLAGGMLFAVPAHAARVELRGSPASMENQNQIAQQQGYTFIGSPAEVKEFVAKERLVRVKSNDDFRIADGVSFPYARPVVKTFVERLGAQYRNACGERLVVTSLTRPRSAQPSNAHQLSVHPAGMAVDLRISTRKACRAWLESTLLELENQELLDVTRERKPPHYHVAVFPEAYMAHLDRLRDAREARSTARAAAQVPSRGTQLGASPTPAAPAVPESSGSGQGALVVLALAAGAVLSQARRRGRG